MSVRQDLLTVLRNTVGAPILQEDPYVVVAPKSVEAVQLCVASARDFSYRVLVLGSGSSFPLDFSILRENVVAIMTIGLTGIEAVSSPAIRVGSGVSVNSIVDGYASSERRTLGGLIADHRVGSMEPVLGYVWPRVSRLEVLTGDCKVNYFSNIATFLIGSRGRLGIITAIEIRASLPIHVSDRVGGKSPSSVNNGDTAIGGVELRTLLDEHGLFQW